jgi:protein-L-isoaspartate O-methyltransferase
MDVRLAEKEGFAGLFLRLRAEGLADKTLLTALEQTPRTLFCRPPIQIVHTRTVWCRSIAVDLLKAQTSLRD